MWRTRSNNPFDGFQGGLHVGNFGIGGLPTPSQPQIQQRRQKQDNGERRHAVPHTHSQYLILSQTLTVINCMHNLVSRTSTVASIVNLIEQIGIVNLCSHVPLRNFLSPGYRSN